MYVQFEFILMAVKLFLKISSAIEKHAIENMQASVLSIAYTFALGAFNYYNLLFESVFVDIFAQYTLKFCHKIRISTFEKYWF